MPDKSFADFFSDVLATRSALGRFLFLMFTLCLFAIGLVYGIFLVLSTRADQLNFEEGDIKASILFQKPTRGGQEYTVMISPQGWQRTGVPVKTGEIIRLAAGGKVHIDLKGLNASLDARNQQEQKIWTARKAGGWKTVKDADFAPEHYFTPKQEKDMKPKWGWIGPDGFTLEEAKANSLPARQAKSICPRKGYGTLLAAIGVGDQSFSRDSILVVGSSNEFIADRDGWLYFAVNDVTNDEDQLFPDMFLIDNIGFFYARVTVAPPAKHGADRSGQAERCAQVQ